MMFRLNHFLRIICQITFLHNDYYYCHVKAQAYMTNFTVKGIICLIISYIPKHIKVQLIIDWTFYKVYVEIDHAEQDLKKIHLPQ